ncbi:MAG TPA: CDP-archaeol synthase [Verrucomicrobiae bacterium]|nr:CDP-archaeol synthase [Verrucomicrobiae bacterium]
MDSIVSALWFFLPAGVANAAPVFAAKLPALKHLKSPMDGGRSYKGTRLFGANKTWRGLIAGIVLATLIIGLQKYLFTHSLWALEHSWFDYRPTSVWLLGPLLGAGALLADVLESFFKRQRRIAPGDSWFPFDQTDYIIGGCLFSLPVVQLSLGKYLLVLIVWLSAHLLSVYIGYLAGIRDKPI